MDLAELFTLQGTLFLLMLLGALLKRVGMISQEGRRCLSNLVIYVILPCAIFKSCLVHSDPDFMKTGIRLFVLASLIEIGSLVLNQILYVRYSPERRKVLKYGTLIPNSGFLGTPIAEGVYHDLGVLYTSVFLIPVRIFMWSFGTSYFMADEGLSRRKLAVKVLTHPCLVAVYLSLFVMLLQLPVPELVRRTVVTIAQCNSAIAMFVVGTILADVDVRTIVNRHSLYYCSVRLLLLPLATLLCGRMLGLGEAALGVSILMMGMPAGAATAIFADRYGSDAAFATQITVLSTLLSMATVVFWCTVMPSP